MDWVYCRERRQGWQTIGDSNLFQKITSTSTYVKHNFANLYCSTGRLNIFSIFCFSCFEKNCLLWSHRAAPSPLWFSLITISRQLDHANTRRTFTCLHGLQIQFSANRHNDSICPIQVRGEATGLLITMHIYEMFHPHYIWILDQYSWVLFWGPTRAETSGLDCIKLWCLVAQKTGDGRMDRQIWNQGRWTHWTFDGGRMTHFAWLSHSQSVPLLPTATEALCSELLSL